MCIFARFDELRDRAERQADGVVRGVRQEVGRPQLAVQAQEDPQRREAASVPLLREEIHSKVSFRCKAVVHMLKVRG